MAKRKKTTKPDLAEESLLLAEEDLAAMRPALAVAPELVVQTLMRQRRIKRKKAAKKAAKKRAQKAAPRKKKTPRARKK